MTTINTPKVIAAATTALMIASLFWLMNTVKVNNSLESDLEKQKLSAEALLSEKLLLEKDMQKFREQLQSMQNKNKDLDAIVKSASEKLSQKEAELSRIKKDNASVAALKKQRQELTAMQSQLENEIQTLMSANRSLENRNNELLATVASLEDRNRLLVQDLNRAMFGAVDQSQVQALKGKNRKLTVKARRTRELMASFEVPANLNNLSFRVIDTKGVVLTPKDGTVAFTTVPSDGSFTASSGGEAEGNKLQSVAMTYTPKTKLTTGLYTVEILNDKLYVGSVKVKLK